MVEFVGTLLAGTMAAQLGILLLEANRACAALAWLLADILLASRQDVVLVDLVTPELEPGPPVMARDALGVVSPLAA